MLTYWLREVFCYAPAEATHRHVPGAAINIDFITCKIYTLRSLTGDKKVLSKVLMMLSRHEQYVTQFYDKKEIETAEQHILLVNRT